MKLNIPFLAVIYILIILLIPGIAQTPEIEHHSSAALEDGNPEFDADGTKNGIVVWAGNKKHLLSETYYVNNHTLRIEPGAIVEADLSAGGAIVSIKGDLVQHEGVTLNNLTINGTGTIDNYIRNCILNNCKIRESGWMEISECQFNTTMRGDIIQVFHKDYPDAIPIIKNNRFSYTENSIKINLLGANAYIEGNSFNIEETQRGYDYAVYLGYKTVINNNDTSYYPKSGKTTILNNEFKTNDFGFSDYTVTLVPHKAIDQYKMAIEIKGNTFQFGRKIVIPVHSDIQILNNIFNGRGISLKKYPIAEGSEILRKPHENFRINNNEFYFAGTEDEAIIYWYYRPSEDPPVETLRNEGFFINATDNYWGHDTGPFNDNDLDGDINLGGGLKISDIIDYKPFVGTGPASDIEMELRVSSDSTAPFHPHNNVTFYPSIEYTLESGEGNIELDVRLTDGTLLMTTSQVEISAGDETIDLSSFDIEIPENTDELIFQARFLTPTGPDAYSNTVKFDVHLQTSTIQITDLRLTPPSEGNYLFQGSRVDISLDLSHTFTAANPGNTGTIEITTVERNRNSPLIIRHQYETITLTAIPGENVENTRDMQLDIQIRDVDDDPSELFIRVKLTTDAGVEVSTETSLPIDKLTNQTEITNFAIVDVVDGKPTYGTHQYFKANEDYTIGVWFVTTVRTPNASEWRLLPKLIFYDESDSEIETRYFRENPTSPPIEFELNYGEQRDEIRAITVNPVPANAKKCKIIAELISNEGKVVHKHEIDIEVRNPTVKNEQSAPEGNSEINFDAIPISIDLQNNQSVGLIEAFQYQGPYEDFESLAKSSNDIKQLNKYWELVTDLTPGTYSSSVSITYNPDIDFPTDEDLDIDLLTIAFWDTLAQDLIFLNSNHDKENYILTANVDYLNSTYVIGYYSPSDIWDKKQSEIPIDYRLFSNYPNPFNPTTKIKFSIPLSDNVQIKIYDILGNELKTLLNDYKQAGTYETEFNASNLPSGVYFYRIISGSFLETKKMLLLK